VTASKKELEAEEKVQICIDILWMKFISDEFSFCFVVVVHM
jgi:hypothetical protein